MQLELYYSYLIPLRRKNMKANFFIMMLNTILSTRRLRFQCRGFTGEGCGKPQKSQHENGFIIFGSGFDKPFGLHDDKKGHKKSYNSFKKSRNDLFEDYTDDSCSDSDYTSNNSDCNSCSDDTSCSDVSPCVQEPECPPKSCDPSDTTCKELVKFGEHFKSSIKSFYGNLFSEYISMITNTVNNIKGSASKYIPNCTGEALEALFSTMDTDGCKLSEMAKKSMRAVQKKAFEDLSKAIKKNFDTENDSIIKNIKCKNLNEIQFYISSDPNTNASANIVNKSNNDISNIYSKMTNELKNILSTSASSCANLQTYIATLTTNYTTITTCQQNGIKGLEEDIKTKASALNNALQTIIERNKELFDQMLTANDELVKRIIFGLMSN